MTFADREWLLSDEAIELLQRLNGCSWGRARKMAEELARGLV